MKASWTAMVVATSISNVALALPKVGHDVPNARVVDVDGKSLELRTLRGKPMLVVYEDQEGTKQNLVLKSELSKRAAGERYRTAISLVAVADVDGYDYWPARGFVKRAIRSESKKLGNKIYVDWNGSMRKSAGFTKGLSTVLLVGADGKILFSHEGTLDMIKRAQLLALLEAEVEGKTER